LTKPQKVEISPSFLLTEENKDESNLQITLAPYILLTTDDDIVMPSSWVVTMAEPLVTLKSMYEDKVNG